MDKIEIRNELDKIFNTIGTLATKISYDVSAENKQKSKKTEEVNRWADCGYKALYATRKFGCAGIEDGKFCETCKYRR